MSNVSASPRSFDLTNEGGYLLAQELDACEIDSLNGCTIYSGNHPKYGNIHIVVPALGNALALLPFDAKPVELQAI